MFNKRILFAASALLALVLMVAACAPSNTPNATNLTMEVTDAGCNPNRIQSDQGNIINIAIKNSTASEVTFAFEEENYRVAIPAGQTVTANFVAPTQTGTYPFACGSSSGEIQVR